MIIHHMEFILTNLREYYLNSDLPPIVLSKLQPFVSAYRPHSPVPCYKELKQEYNYEQCKSHCSLTGIVEDRESM